MRFSMLLMEEGAVRIECKTAFGQEASNQSSFECDIRRSDVALYLIVEGPKIHGAASTFSKV
jgi:hypothetical protein